MKNKKILLIDDDEELCNELAELLRSEGFTVENTPDPFDGKARIETTDYDLVILDYKMPELNGVDLLRIAKNKNPGTAVFMVTGRPFVEKFLEEERVSALVDAVISKPFSDDTLLSQIRKSLSR